MSDVGTASREELAQTALVALGARLGVALLAANRFPAADDGVLYDRLARRLEAGLGYSWAWPDGTVTPVAHYPVGYPAFLATAYRLLGAQPLAALAFQALVGAVGAVGVHFLAASASRRSGACAGLAVALHPALLTYTPAIMTEGLCAALLALPMAVAWASTSAGSSGSRAAAALTAGALLGATVLVRPQAALVLPVVSLLALSWKRRAPLLGPALVVASTLGTVLPWTLRNEQALGRPVFVSANSGWNLLIGTDPLARGTFRTLDVPVECREVWNEADKDACFGASARRRIAEAPWTWLALVPQKLAATFDVGGSGGSYLSRSRPDLVSRPLVYALGGLETLVERATVAVSLLCLGGEEGRWRRFRRVLAGASLVPLFTLHAWPAYVGLFVLLALGGRKTWTTGPLRLVTLGVLGASLVTHAVYFGAARYALLVYPWTAALALAFLATHRESGSGLMNVWGLRRHEG